MPNTLINKVATVSMTWAALTGALEYEVQFSADPRFKVLEKDVTGLGTPASGSLALTNGKKYYYRYRARTTANLAADQGNASVASGTGSALRDAAGRTYLAQGFTPAASYPIKRVSINLKKTGAPGNNVWVEIWSASAGAPSAIIGAASATMVANTTTTSFVAYNFDFTAPIPVVAGTLYYIVVRGDYVVNGADYLTWENDNVGNYASGAAYKGDGTPAWSTNGAPDQIFATYYANSWGLWQPVRSIWVDTALLASYTPAATTGFILVDPDDINDNYVFTVAPQYNIKPTHVRRAFEANIKGDLLTEYTATRDTIRLTFDPAYIKWDQAAEIARFYEKRKAVFLIIMTDYVQDVQERIYKVEFAAEPDLTPLADGREDYFKGVVDLMEAALS